MQDVLGDVGQQSMVEQEVLKPGPLHTIGFISNFMNQKEKFPYLWNELDREKIATFSSLDMKNPHNRLLEKTAEKITQYKCPEGCYGYFNIRTCYLLYTTCWIDNSKQDSFMEQIHS